MRLLDIEYSTDNDNKVVFLKTNWVSVSMSHIECRKLFLEREIRIKAANAERASFVLKKLLKSKFSSKKKKETKGRLKTAITILSNQNQ